MFVNCPTNFLRLNFFNFTLRLKGFPIGKAKQQLQKIQEISDADYPSYMKEQRKAIYNHHLEHNTFYKKFIGNRIPEDWGEIPVMHKSDLQQPLKDRLSKGYTSKNIYVNKTSGSSGHPFVFAKDKWTHALTWAIIHDRFGWHGLDIDHSYQARFYGIPLNSLGYAKERLKDALSSRFRFPVFDLSEKKLQQFYKKFTKTKFDYLNGYTSSIVLFAKYLLDKKIVLKTICPTLKVCIVTSEMLFDSDKLLMEKQFGVPVINEYGASELDLIAFTDTNDKFIVNSETLFVEILDEKNQPVPKGISGRIVITSLYNKAHPFIRYDIGDMGILDEKSNLKTPVLKELIGRTNDVALLPSGKMVPGLTFYYVTKSIMEDSGNVKEFVITQTKRDTFEIDYTSERKLNNKEKKEVEKAIETYLEAGLITYLNRVAFLDRKNRGKLKQFTSLLHVR